jgi:hypothetical protein
MKTLIAFALVLAIFIPAAAKDHDRVVVVCTTSIGIHYWDQPGREATYLALIYRSDDDYAVIQLVTADWRHQSVLTRAALNGRRVRVTGRLVNRHLQAVRNAVFVQVLTVAIVAE